MNAVGTRNDALEHIANLRSEVARLHWYAHQSLNGKAGIDKEGALAEFSDAASEIGMQLNFLTDSISELTRMAVEKEAAE